MNRAEAEVAPVRRSEPPRRAAGGPAARPLAALAAYLGVLAAASAATAVLVMVGGGSPTAVVRAVWQGSMGSAQAVGQTLDQTAPYLLVAVGSVVATRAGLFNIGQEGQLAVGGLAGAGVGLTVHLPGPLAIPAVLVAAAAGGALWAGLAAVLKYWRNVDEVISSLLLVFVADQVLSFAVNRTWLLQAGGDGAVGRPPISDPLPGAAGLATQFLGVFTFTAALPIALVVLTAVVVVLTFSAVGFRLRLLGMNPVLARRFGVRAVRYGGGAMCVSGALAGLAGGLMLTGDTHRIQAGFANDVSWEGLLVALVAREQPLLVLPAALFFAMLRAGGAFLAATGVDGVVVTVVQALLVLAAVLPPLLVPGRPAAGTSQAV